MVIGNLMIHGSKQKLFDTLAVMLENRNARCVVIDRPEVGPVYVLAFSVNWNRLRDKIEEKAALPSVLLAGGPAE
jgi:hypothetical protein